VVVLNHYYHIPNHQTIILHLQFLTSALNEGYTTLDFVDKEITVDYVKYDLIGVTYANGSHFFTRYLRDGKTFEADGMRKHDTSRGFGRYLVREAMSVEIDETYESAMAGHINWSLSADNIKVGGHKAGEIYYMKRPEFNN
jgi:hypothetical protein